MDGMDTNMVALLVGRAELDKNTVRGVAGWERVDGNTVVALAGRAEQDNNTVRWLLDGKEVDGMNGSTVALVVSWIWTRWLTLGGGEVDGNMVALLVGRAELNRDTVRDAAGRGIGGWDGWEH